MVGETDELSTSVIGVVVSLENVSENDSKIFVNRYFAFHKVLYFYSIYCSRTDAATYISSFSVFTPLGLIK